MSKQHPSNPFQALNESEDISGLNSLARKAQLLAQIEQLVDAIIPVDIRPHIQVANVRNQTLILLTDSPAWNTKMRFLGHTLLTELNTLCNSNLSGIQILTRPRRTKAPSRHRSTKRPTVPSTLTAERIAQAAQQFDDDALKESLQRLSRHLMEINQQQ